MGDQDSTCWTLVRGAASGNHADRETFAMRYGPVISAYLSARWKLPWDHDTVADAAQEVFLQLFKPRGALQRVESGREGGFRAFLYGVLRNVAASTEARTNRRRGLGTGGILEELPDAEESPSQAFDQAWARLITQEARALMASRARRGASKLWFQALEMRYQEALPSREIAKRLGLSSQESYQALTRARREFRSALLEVMAGYHPGDTKAALEQRCVDLLSLL